MNCIMQPAVVCGLQSETARCESLTTSGMNFGKCRDRINTTLFLGQTTKRRLNPTNCVKLIEAGLEKAGANFQCHI